MEQFYRRTIDVYDGNGRKVATIPFIVPDDKRADSEWQLEEAANLVRAHQSSGLKPTTRYFSLSGWPLEPVWVVPPEPQTNDGKEEE